MDNKIDAAYVRKLLGDDLDDATVDFALKIVNEAPAASQHKVEHTIFTEVRKMLDSRFRDAQLDMLTRIGVADAVADALRPFVISLTAVASKQAYELAFDTRAALDALAHHARQTRISDDDGPVLEV